MNTPNPYSAPPVIEPRRDGPQYALSLGRMALAWVCFFLMSTVISAIVGAIVGVVLGALLGMAGFPLETLILLCQIAGFLSSIPVNFLCFWLMVRLLVVPQVVRDMS